MKSRIGQVTPHSWLVNETVKQIDKLKVQPDMIKDNIEKKHLKINFYEVATNTNSLLEVNNLMSGEELKKLFCEKNNISSDEFNIRLFFAGNEITNSHYLYQYNIINY